MVIQITPVVPPTRSSRRERALQYDSFLRTPSIGCSDCKDVGICGGLRIKQAVYNCLQFCCKRPETCDAVCRNNPATFAERVREVGGFDLGNIPQLARVVAPSLPSLVPVIYHRTDRLQMFSDSPAIALPLYKVIKRQNGEPRFHNRKALADAFKIDPNSTILLTGSGRDAPLERWWSLGPMRVDVIRAVRDLGIGIATTPNFSLFTDLPRWDDLHSMKRIALTHEEFMANGVAAALHLNARTDRDWSRWAAYIKARLEITHVAFEFATGAGAASRIAWYGQQLVTLARKVDRPLHLIVRGGNRVLVELRANFESVTVLETNVFMKTLHRQQLVVEANGKLVASSLLMEKSDPLDNLFVRNWRATVESMNRMKFSGEAIG